MNLQAAKRMGVALQIALLISVVTYIYFEKTNYLWLELGLVAVMFGISMGMLFVSKKEDERNIQKNVKVRQNIM